MIKNFAIFVFTIMTFLYVSSHDFVRSSESKKAWNDRMKLFKEMGKNMRQLKRADNASAMVKSAAVIHANAKKLSNLVFWPDGSGQGETRAKIEIWRNIEDFRGKFKALERSSSQLVAIAKTQDLDASKVAFKKMARTCGSCHREYRSPKKW